MQSDRHLIFILCICLVIIGISAGVKIQQVIDRETRVRNIVAVRDAVTVGGGDIPLQADPGFFEIEPELQVAASAPAVDDAATPVSEIPATPTVTARAYLVGDAKTGKIYLEHNSRAVLPVASMSKLVTAFVATDVFSATTTFTITEDALKVPPDASGLQVGEVFTRDEILKPLLLSSSNSAAEAISLSMDRTQFLELMSGYAWEVGMPQSYFADPSGVSASNAASARDIFGLARYLYDFRPDILALTRVSRFWMATTTEHGSHEIVSTHPFVSDKRFIGGKTGRTIEAGETMLTILDIEGEPLVLIVMGSHYGMRESDTRLLLERAAVIMMAED